MIFLVLFPIFSSFLFFVPFSFPSFPFLIFIFFSLSSIASKGCGPHPPGARQPSPRSGAYGRRGQPHLTWARPLLGPRRQPSQGLAGKWPAIEEKKKEMGKNKRKKGKNKRTKMPLISWWGPTLFWENNSTSCIYLKKYSLQTFIWHKIYLRSSFEKMI